MQFEASRITATTRSVLIGLALVLLPGPGIAQVLQYSQLTDLPAGPGQGRSPSINNSGDVAFWLPASPDAEVYFHDRSEGSFLNLLSLPGAPAQGGVPKLNNLGNIVFMEQGSRDMWLFERASQSLTNLSALPGHPGPSQAHSVASVFDINDSNQISFHSGDLNVGDIYLYEHATGTFLNASDQVGGAGRGRENTINNAGQIAYMGFPEVHVFDIAGGTTTRPLPADLTLWPFTFNDEGDFALFRAGVSLFYDASEDTVLDLSLLPGYPPIGQPASIWENGLSNHGEITFWQDQAGLFYFEPTNQTFTRMSGQGIVPASGYSTSINNFGEIALEGGADLFLAQVLNATPRVRLQINGARPEIPMSTGTGTIALTLDMEPGTGTATLDWYYMIYVSATAQVLWVTPAGLSAAPSPLVTATPAVSLNSLPILNLASPPGSPLTFGFFLLQGSTVVARDLVTAVPGAP